MRRSTSILALALVACGGAAPSSLTGDADGGITSTPDSSVTPPDDGAPPDHPDATTLDDGGSTATDSGGTKDSGVVVEAGPTDPGVYCGQSLECNPSSALCCITQTQWYPQAQYSYACENLPSITPCVGGTAVYCDDDHDCASGVCCGDLGSSGYAKVSCKPTCTGYAYTYQQIHFCDPNAPTCDSGQTCKPSTVLAGYYVCN